MKMIASPRVLATASAVIATLTTSGLPASAQQGVADAQSSVFHVMGSILATTGKTPSTPAKGGHSQWQPLSCVHDIPLWLRDVGGSLYGHCQFEDHVREYIERGNVLPLPICFYPGDKAVPADLSRVLALNIALMKAQAKAPKPTIYYLDSIIGSEAEEKPFPDLACDRGSGVNNKTDQWARGTLFSRSFPGRTILYKAERPEGLPICP